MRTFFALLAALTISCASSPPHQPQGRIALVTNAPWYAVGPTVARRVQTLIHATTVVDRLSDIDESAFDTVVVLHPAQGGLYQRTYDVTADSRDSTSRSTIAYEVRRGGAVARKGSIVVVTPDPFGRSPNVQANLEGLPTLLRDVSNSTPPAARTP